MKDKSILVISCTVCLIAMMFATISNPAQSIKCNSPITRSKIIPSNRVTSQIGKDNNALTNWQFKIKNKIKGSSTNQRIQNSLYRVKFRIISVKVETSLLIDVLLPPDASEDLKSHEQGHVIICKKVYESSSKNLALLLERFRKKTFTAEGISFEMAQKAALESSNNWLVKEYDLISNKRATSISQIYDRLSRESNDPPVRLIDKAMQSSKSPI